MWLSHTTFKDYCKMVCVSLEWNFPAEQKYAACNTLQGLSNKFVVQHMVHRLKGYYSAL